MFFCNTKNCGIINKTNRVTFQTKFFPLLNVDNKVTSVHTQTIESHWNLQIINEKEERLSAKFSSIRISQWIHVVWLFLIKLFESVLQQHRRSVTITIINNDSLIKKKNVSCIYVLNASSLSFLYITYYKCQKKII